MPGSAKPGTTGLYEDWRQWPSPTTKPTLPSPNLPSLGLDVSGNVLLHDPLRVENLGVDSER